MVFFSGSSVFVILLLSCTVPSVAPGYIDCTPGTLNVILSAPHGGYETPPEISNRVAGCWVNNQCVYEHGCGTMDVTQCAVKTLRHGNTKEITLILASQLYNLTGKQPHVVVNNLHRSKMDANREINKATFGDPTSETAYNEYHQCITNARAAIEADNSVQNRGLFLDMHGHTHPTELTELGYLIVKGRLNSGNLLAKYSSLHALDSHSALPFETLVRGNDSFGYLLQQEGYGAMPSPQNPAPGSEPYHSGGYNTRTHGSRDSGKVDGIQIESPKPVRLDVTRGPYANALGRAIVNFMNVHY